MQGRGGNGVIDPISLLPLRSSVSSGWLVTVRLQPKPAKDFPPNNSGCLFDVNRIPIRLHLVNLATLCAPEIVICSLRNFGRLDSQENSVLWAQPLQFNLYFLPIIIVIPPLQESLL